MYVWRTNCVVSLHTGIQLIKLCSMSQPFKYFYPFIHYSWTEATKYNNYIVHTWRWLRNYTDVCFVRRNRTSIRYVLYLLKRSIRMKREWPWCCPQGHSIPATLKGLVSHSTCKENHRKYTAESLPITFIACPFMTYLYLTLSFAIYPWILCLFLGNCYISFVRCMRTYAWNCEQE